MRKAPDQREEKVSLGFKSIEYHFNVEIDYHCCGVYDFHFEFSKAADEHFMLAARVERIFKIIFNFRVF